MRLLLRFGAAVAASLVLSLLLAFCASRAHGEQAAADPSALLVAIQRLPVYHEDRATPELKAVQLAELAHAIEDASEPPPPGVKVKDWQALIVAIGWHESTFSIRIHRGECKPHECDGGRARGPWQQHRNGRNDRDWDALHGLEHVAFQAETASLQLRRAYLTCVRNVAAKQSATWLQGTINNYAGRPCAATGWEGLEERQATWAKVRKRL